MRVLVQRVASASVRVGDELVGAIERGIVALVGVGRDDDVEQARRLGHKAATLRIFPGDGEGPERSLVDTGFAALVISQFTLLGDTRRGSRPSWSAAAPADLAEPVVAAFADAVERAGVTVARGRFGAHMQVELVNDGPVTVLLGE